MSECLECKVEINNKCNRKYCTTLCRNRYYHKHTRFNKDYKKAKKREWYLQNKDAEINKIKAYQVLNKEHLAKTHNQYMNKRKQTDLSFKIACNLRSRLSRLIKNKKVGSSVDDLGCSIGELKIHLESKFEPGMTWETHGIKGWHIDHIRPLSSFDLSDRFQLFEACHYTNLQPLWWYDNLDKGSK